MSNQQAPPVFLFRMPVPLEILTKPLEAADGHGTDRRRRVQCCHIREIEPGKKYRLVFFWSCFSSFFLSVVHKASPFFFGVLILNDFDTFIYFLCIAMHKISDKMMDVTDMDGGICYFSESRGGIVAIYLTALVLHLVMSHFWGL